MLPLLATLALSATAPPLAPVGEYPELKHDGEATAVAFSPDGKRILTGTSKGAVLRWDVATGKETWSYAGAEGAVLSLAWSPDGKHIAAGDEKGVASLWEAEKTRTRAKVRTEGAPIRGLAFTPDGADLLVPYCGQFGGQYIQASLGRHAIKRALRLVIDVNVGGLRVILHGVALAPDGKSILVGSRLPLEEGASAAFHRVDLASWKSVLLAADPKPKPVVLRPPVREIYDLPPRGIYGGVGAKVGKLEIPVTVKKKDVTALPPALVAFAPNGRGWAGVKEDRVIFFNDGKPAGAIKGEAVVGLAYTPDGKSLITASRDGHVILTDLATVKESSRLKNLGTLNAFALSPDGKRFAVTRTDGKSLIRDVPAARTPK